MIMPPECNEFEEAEKSCVKWLFDMYLLTLMV